MRAAEGWCGCDLQYQLQESREVEGPCYPDGLRENASPSLTLVDPVRPGFLGKKAHLEASLLVI